MDEAELPAEALGGAELGGDVEKPCARMACGEVLVDVIALRGRRVTVEGSCVDVG